MHCDYDHIVSNSLRYLGRIFSLLEILLSMHLTTRLVEPRLTMVSTYGLMTFIQAFVIKTNDIDKSTSKFGNLMPDFIDEQRNKDLLDVRLSQ